MNLFQQDDPNLFEGMTPPEAQAGSTDDVRRTARLAALATLPPETQVYFEHMDEMTRINEERIAREGDAALRAEMVLRDQQERLDNLGGLIAGAIPTLSQEDRQGAALAYQGIIEADNSERAAYLLEQRAVQRVQDLAASGDITQARLYLNNLDNGDALDVRRDWETRSLILQREIDRARIAQEDQPWFRDVADFFSSWIPFDTSTGNVGNVDVAEGLTNWYDNLFSGERVRRESETLWSMPLEQFSQYVREELIPNIEANATNIVGHRSNSQMLNILSQLDRAPEAWQTNAFDTLDIVGVIPFARFASFARGFRAIPFMVRNGARTQAVDTVVDAVLRAERSNMDDALRGTGMAEDELTDALTPSALNTNPNDLGVRVGVEASDRLDRARAAVREMTRQGDLTGQARMSSEEFGELTRTVERDIRAEFGNRFVKDIHFDQIGLAGESTVNRVTFQVGRARGGGFSQSRHAREWLEVLGEEGTVVRDASGQYFAQITRILPEHGFYSPLNVRNAFFGRVFSGRVISDEFIANIAQNSGNLRNKLITNFIKPYEKTFRRLTTAERNTLDQIMKKGENEAVWFSDEQLEEIYARLENRRPSAAELEAYNARRDINDFEWAVRNDEEYKKLALGGHENVKFKIGDFEVNANAVINDVAEAPPKQRFFDLASGTHYNRLNQVTEAQWRNFRAGGYRMIILDRPVALPDGTKINTFAARATDTVRGPLNPIQLSYRAGGHRMYKGKYFVKQTVRGKQEDTGEQFLENPNTYIAAETRAEAGFWAKRMEAARLAYLAGDDVTVIDEILGGHPGLPDAEEFMDLMSRRKLQADEPFEVLGDRELPSVYTKTPEGVEWIDLDETGFNGMLRTQGRMYTGQKGDHLPDFMGNMAPTLDSFETLNRSLMNIASITSYSDYKITSVARWVETFKSVLDPSSYDDTASDMFKFMHGRLIPANRLSDAEVRVLQEAERQREVIRRVIGWKTPWDHTVERMNRQFADFIAGDRVGGVIPDARRGLSNWWSESNPVNVIRGIAFDLKLGLFNIAQLPLQASSAVAATILSPKRGMQGWALAPFNIGLHSRRNIADLENYLTELVNRDVHKLGGFETAREFKEFSRSMWRNGFFDVGGTHAFLDNYGPSAAMNGFASGVERVRDAGRFFFNRGERINREVAWRIAWDEARVKFPGRSSSDREFLNYLQGRAEDYSFGMSRESQAWWQKGILSIPTQFWSYNARMIEALLGKSGFTLAQRGRLFAMHAALYGTAGIPVAGAIADVIQQKTGQVPEIGSLGSYFDRGIVDNWIYSITGADVQVGERFGTGGWIADTVGKLFGFSQYGETPAPMEVLGGASYSISKDVIESVMDYVSAESGDTTRALTRDSLLRVARNISTVNNGLRAYMAWQYGIYESGRTGGDLLTDLPDSTAMFLAFGIQPGELDVITARTAWKRNREDSINEAARVITNYRVDMLNRPDQRQTIQEDVNAFVRLLPPEIRREVLARAHEDVDPSLYASLQQYYENNSGESN